MCWNLATMWTAYYINNLQGDVVSVENNDLTIASYAYDAWGNVTAITGTYAELRPFGYRSGIFLFLSVFDQHIFQRIDGLSVCLLKGVCINNNPPIFDTMFFPVDKGQYFAFSHQHSILSHFLSFFSFDYNVSGKR